MTDFLNKFDHRINPLAAHLIAALSEIEGLRGEFKSGLRSAPQSITNLRRSVIVTSAGASTRIEGSTLSDEEVERIMTGISRSSLSDRDTQEVQGYLEVIQNVFDCYETLPLRESTITALHKQLLKYSDKDDLHRGSYKKKENAVGILDQSGNVSTIIFKTTPAYLAAKEMQELVEWSANALEQSRFHPLLIIANFIVEFLKIHPFEDGNGRLSRVLTNLLLLRCGYQFVQYVSHEHIIEHRKDEYYLALRQSQITFDTESETITPWLNFFLSVIQGQAKTALDYLEKENIEDILSPKQSKVWKYLLSVEEASPSQIVKATEIALGTVRQALERLVELSLLKRIGQGRGSRYVKL